MTNTSPEPVPVRAVLWRELQWPGTQWCTLAETADGWRIAGAVISAPDDEPTYVRYQIALDGHWATREVEVVLRRGIAPERRLNLTVNEAQRWHVTRDPASSANAAAEGAALHGLIDIDLGCAPATNTLPIRRLQPAIGEAVDVTAAWVSFPELRLEPLPQRYTRLTAQRYHYASDGGAFTAEIDVDDLGLVTRYSGGWERG